MDQSHKAGGDVKQLPALVPNNKYLKTGGFLQTVGNIQGLQRERESTRCMR